MTTNINNTKTTIETTSYPRANRISVKAVGQAYQADFYKTHKHIATILSNETGWTANPDQNKSAQREDFRQFCIDHAADMSVRYDPTDNRDARNLRLPTYMDDADVQVDAQTMLDADLRLLLAASNPYDIEMAKDAEGKYSIAMEHIAPKTQTSKGTALALLGIDNGRYPNGNWAWADIDMVVTFRHKPTDTTFQMLYPLELVSGQLKKNKLTKTAFADGIYEELLALGKVEKKLSKEEKKALAKAEKSAKAEAKKQEESKAEETPKATETAKKPRNTTKKGSTTKKTPKTTKAAEKKEEC